jgi:hypothetical protein
MKRRWAVVMFFAGSFFGGLIGYSSRPTAASLELKNEILLKNPRDRKEKAGAEAHSQKWQSLAKQVTTFSDEDRKSFLKQLVPTDRRKALDALMSQIGPGSSSYLVTSTMNEIIKSWAVEDFEEALSYCQKCTNDGMRKHVLGKLLEILVEKDPDRTIELFVEQKVEDPTFQSEVVFELARTKMGGSADQLVNLLSKLPMSSGSSGTGVKFSNDYDFQTAADGIMAMIKANPGKTPTVLPTNLMESWAALDPDAAQAWWVKNGSFEYNRWSKLLNGVEKHSTPEAAAAWVVAKFEEPGALRGKMIQDLAYDGGEEIAGRINTIARSMPDVAAQDRFLTDVIVENWHSLSNRYRFAISGLSSPQARLTVFQKIGSEHDVIGLQEINDAQFQAWGLTRQQVESIFPQK